MSPLPLQPTSTNTWFNAPVLPDQNTLGYLTQDAMSRPEIASFDPSSGDEQPQASTPHSFSGSPSPVSFPPSPITTTDSLPCSLSLGFMSLSATCSSANVTSIAIDGPYPNPLLDDLAPQGQHFIHTAHPFDPATTACSSATIPAVPATGFDGTLSNAPWMHIHPHHTVPRSHAHWHPYNRQQSIFPQQLSAPSSPLQLSNMDSTWFPITQHRRVVSAGHPLPIHADRRSSEGDVVGAPDFSMSLSFLQDCASSTSSNEMGGPGSSPPFLPLDFPPTLDTVSAPLQMTSASCSSAAPATGTNSGPNAQGVYKCEHEGCNKSFSRPYNLNSHLRTHTNLRPFRCEHCDRHFARLHDKNRHERLHRGVRPFACERCQHHFARMDALNRHLKVEGGRNLCNMYLIEKNSPNAMPIVELPPKKINPLILAHFPNFGKSTEEDDSAASNP